MLQIRSAGLVAFIGIVVSVLASAVGAETQHIVDTGYAKYLGALTPPFSVAFLGVPYAQPPVGNMRFRAPKALDTESLKLNKGVVNATTYPDFCVQGSIGQGDAGGAGSEDCLKVNIYAPSNATFHSNLPVLVYIHGGGYVYGNPRNWPFDHWINQSPNVVVVSVYYRLDSFGFLAHPSFSDPANGDFNAGLQDQILALKWVQENIASFGGNPSKVTINGQSAGAGSVQMHMIANEGAKRLFSGGIIQSLDSSEMPTAEQQEPLFNFFAEQAGCGEQSITATLACLRNASVSALARAQDAGANFNGSLYKVWNPMIDGKILPDLPTKLLLEGKFAHVPVIVGSTSNETTSTSTDISGTLQRQFPQLTASDLSEFSVVYNRSQFSSDEEWIRTSNGEPNLRCGREKIGDAVLKFNNAWTYRYNQPNPTQNEPGITEHAAENWMMFLGTNTGFNGSTVFTGLNAVETAFSEELIAYWLSFVRAENPNTFKLARSPEWPGFQTNQRTVLQEDPGNSTVKSGVFVETEFAGDASRCAFVAAKSEHLQN
ncbi:alpha/beta-hydrolase [Schizopora paradoxa]|uniref:Carboxylic ester hydrolase n=1 Tax=Schizopora paradoxa TaxID=27342 RepID=A0A0H2RYK2_9AGAM|nr:alpha/beta-hydrolase [Schizopora paradoxa]